MSEYHTHSRKHTHVHEVKHLVERFDRSVTCPAYDDEFGEKKKKIDLATKEGVFCSFFIVVIIIVEHVPTHVPPVIHERTRIRVMPGKARAYTHTICGSCAYKSCSTRVHTPTIKTRAHTTYQSQSTRIHTHNAWNMRIQTCS